MNKKGIGLRPMMTNLSLVLLFSFFMLSFVYTSIEIQNPNSDIFSDTYGLNNSKNSMESTLGNFTDTSDNIFNQIAEDKPTAVDFLFLIFKGAFYIPWTFLSFAITSLNALVVVIFPALAGTGLGSITTTATAIMLSSILVTIVLLTVKAIRTGESER